MCSMVTEVVRAVDDVRRARVGGRQKPHRLILLLAVVELADDGLLVGNRLYWSDQLVSRFTELFAQYSQPGDWCQPAPPFFHLRTSAFWTLVPKAGKEAEYAALSTSGGGSRRIRETIDHVELGEDLCACLNDPGARQDLRDALVARLGRREAERTTPEHR